MKPVNCMTHNLAKHLEPKARRAAGLTAIALCSGGIGVLNEIHEADAAFYRSHLKRMGLRWSRRGQNAIVWDPRAVTRLGFSSRRIMRGGFVGADGVPGVGDDRRVGPSRRALKWVGKFNDTEERFMVIAVHKMARAFTLHKWRQKLWWNSTRNVSRFVNRSIKWYPRGFIAGDENAPFYVDYPNLDDRAVKTPATHGKQRYDQVHLFGDLIAEGMTEFYTPSDHDGLRWRIRQKGAFRPN